MATFKQRESGWWQAVVRRKGHPQQSKTFPSKLDAEKWARDIENQIDRGIFVPREEAERTTLHEALERYQREVGSSKKGKNQETYRIKAWQAEELATRSLASLKQADFAKWRDERLAAGVAPATVRLDLAVISHLFTIAVKEWGLHLENPIKRIRLPAVANARDRRLEGDEEARLLAEMDSPAAGRSNPWIKPLVRFAIETAMRQGELLALEWKHVDLKKRVAHIHLTKNGDPRDVPLSSTAVEILSALPRSISGQVFPTTASAVKQSFTRATKRAEIEDLHFHDLRHEATSRLADKLAMHELMKVTGHKDTRMLARYYHPRAEDLAKKLG